MLCPWSRPQCIVRPRASLPSPRVRALNTTPKTYLQQQSREIKSGHQPRASCFRIYSTSSFSQFAVLDEDALCELVSLFEDLLIVDVGHGRNKALEEEQHVAHTQRSKLLQCPVPPLLPRQGCHPWFTSTAISSQSQGMEKREWNNKCNISTMSYPVFPTFSTSCWWYIYDIFLKWDLNYWSHNAKNMVSKSMSQESGCVNWRPTGL